MSTRTLEKYVDILKDKGEEIVDALKDMEISDARLRDYIVNFNNIFTNVQQYEMLIKEIEAEKAELSE